MYSIYADGVCIYNDVFSLDDMKVVTPQADAGGQRGRLP